MPVAGLDTQAPPVHWASVAKRMKFSRQQKLHFKLALQVRCEYPLLRHI